MLNRRTLITGLISFAAAPAIVRASSLMPVKVMETTLSPQQLLNKIWSDRVIYIFNQTVEFRYDLPPNRS